MSRIIREHIDTDDENSIIAEPVTKVGKVVNCKMLNFRQYPIANSNNVISTIGTGTEVTIVDEVNEFYMVKHAGTTGYVMKKFIEVK